MPYTALRPPETAWARHLDNVRMERKWSATALWEDVYKRLVGADGKALGLGPKSLSAFKPVLIDKPMPKEWAAALATLYGKPPPELDATEAPATDPSVAERALLVAVDHVKAIREQTKVMRQLLGALTAAASTAAPAGTSPIEAVVSQVIGRSASPLPTETHAPTG